MLLVRNEKSICVFGAKSGMKYAMKKVSNCLKIIEMETLWYCIINVARRWIKKREEKIAQNMFPVIISW